MSEAHTFDHNGIKVEFQRGTVRTGLEARRIRQKLVRAYGYGGDGESVETMPQDDYDNIDEYASAMSRTKADAPWRGHSNMTDEQLRMAYETFLDEDEDLYNKFRSAAFATSTPKKTT